MSTPTEETPLYTPASRGDHPPQIPQVGNPPPYTTVVLEQPQATVVTSVSYNNRTLASDITSHNFSFTVWS